MLKKRYRKCKSVPKAPKYSICDGCPRYPNGGGKCVNRDKYVRDKSWKKEIGEIND